MPCVHTLFYYNKWANNSNCNKWSSLEQEQCYLAVRLFAFGFIREPSHPLCCWQPSYYLTLYCFILAWPRHSSCSRSSWPNVISPGSTPLLKYMCHSLIWGSKDGVCLMSPTLCHHRSCCEPCRAAWICHLHWKESDTWSKPPGDRLLLSWGSRGGKGTCIPEGRKKEDARERWKNQKGHNSCLCMGDRAFLQGVLWWYSKYYRVLPRLHGKCTIVSSCGICPVRQHLT